jgi:hypothetical protein
MQNDPDDGLIRGHGFTISPQEYEACQIANTVLAMQGIYGHIIDIQEMEEDMSKMWLEEFRNMVVI